MYRNLFLLFILIISSRTVFAQGEIQTEKEIFFRNERSIGILFNNNGIGIDYRYGKFINAYKKHLYEINLNNLKHYKEVKIVNPWYPSLNRYVYGKVNTVFDINAGKGRQNVYFFKQDAGSVEIRSFYFAGFSLAVLKPIYYKVRYSQDLEKYEKFDPVLHRSSDIIGKAGYFYGIDETFIIPGIYIKAGVSFEYAKRDFQIRALEAGVTVNAFLQTPEIMAQIDNQQIVISVFLLYRFGKVFHGAQFKNLNTKENSGF